MDKNNTLKAFVKELPADNNSYFKILGESETQTMRSGLVTLNSGESIGEHTTSGNEEMLIVISGKGEVDINKNESRFNIEKGKIAYVPPNTIHNVINKSKEDLKYIYVIAKA